MSMKLSVVTAAWIIVWALGYSLPVQARGYGGHYYGSHYGYGYSGHHGYRHGRYGHGYRHHGYRHGRYGYGYRHGYRHYGRYGHHRGPYYVYRHNSYRYPVYSGRHYRSHGHGPLYTLLSVPAHLAYGILKTPAVIVDSLTRPHSSENYTSDGNSIPQHIRKDQATTQSTQINQPVKKNSRASGSGWDALAEGRYSDALQLFRILAETNPDRGIPKAGYAIAAAADGDLDRGIWAMKRALQYDAESLNYLRMDMELGATLTNLISHYQIRMNNDQDSDTGLMLASLYFLSGDLGTARQTLELSRQYGQSDNLTRLDNLISQNEN